MLGERNGLYVQLSLIPITIGLILCSAYELSFTLIGFLAALGTNLAEWYVLIGSDQVNNNNNNLRVSNIRVSNRTLIYNVCPKSALT